MALLSHLRRFRVDVLWIIGSHVRRKEGGRGGGKLTLIERKHWTMFLVILHGRSDCGFSEGASDVTEVIGIAWGGES